MSQNQVNKKSGSAHSFVLDYEAQSHLQHAQAFTARVLGGSPRSGSTIVRRALQLYCAHVDKLTKLQRKDANATALQEERSYLEQAKRGNIPNWQNYPESLAGQPFPTYPELRSAHAPRKLSPAEAAAKILASAEIPWRTR